MAGELQPLDLQFPIVDAQGRPTQYFIRWAQQRQLDIGTSITLDDLEAFLTAHKLQAGHGIILTPDGDINHSPSISIANGTGLNFDVMGNIKIADTAVVPGTYGDATHVPAIVVDQQGRITGVTLVAISGGGGAGALTKISQQVLGANAANVSFTAIPATYTDLILVATARGDKAATFAEVRARFNADSGANYDWEFPSVNNATFTATGNVAQTYNFLGWMPASTGPANAASSVELVIPNYKGTVFHKDWRANAGLRNGAAAGNMFEAWNWGDWRNTAAINQIDIFPDANNFIIGSTFTLYGRG